MDHPFPWLRYLDADKIESPDFVVDGMRVRNDAGERLGKIDGFVVDSDSGRPYYVVVDAGGWFRSREFLVPIGLTRLDGDHDALVVDLSKDRISRFPGFDTHEFANFSEADVRRMNDDICQVCSLDVVTFGVDEPYTEAWKRPHFQEPDWWTAMPSHPDRMGDDAFANQVEYPPVNREHQDHRRRA